MKRIFGALLVLVLAVGLCTTSWAAEDNTYLDETGEAQPIPGGAVTVTQDNIPTTPWSAGWYVIRGSVTISGALTLTNGGTVNLVLADGCELIANGGIYQNSGALNIYGQSGGSGKLTINGGYKWAADRDYYAGIYGANLVINGGIITITAAPGEASFAMNIMFLTMNGGNLKAAAGAATNISAGISATVTINGGTVAATAEEGGTRSLGVRADIIRVTGGSLTASGSGDNGRGVGWDTPVTVTIPATCWWRTAKDGAYNTQDAWGDMSIDGAYMELTTTDPTPVKHYYYVPTEAEETIEAPQTFDAGVAVYGVMAVSALLGMGVVKKKAF